jgi:uncharacterized membrane protein
LKTLTTAIFLLLLSIFLGVPAHSFSIPGLNRAESVKELNSTVIIPAKKIDTKARFFSFKDGGKEIRFFAVKGSNGAIRVAFDACDACYREKKGYEQQVDRMICRNCNMKFPIDRLGPNATGGCNPGFLPHRLDGNNIIINTSDLRTGSRYF